MPTRDRRMLHACRCRSLLCEYPGCRKVKLVFRHMMQCNVRASGGCLLCKSMWHFLQLHARACKETECHVPRCRDLKEHLERPQQQSDSRIRDLKEQLERLQQQSDSRIRDLKEHLERLQQQSDSRIRDLKEQLERLSALLRESDCCNGAAEVAGNQNRR